jgi:hypothetical protein
MVGCHGLGTEPPHTLSPPIRLAGKQHYKIDTKNKKNFPNSLNMRGLGRVVLSPPCAGWLDGVEAVTGHDDGEVRFWRLVYNKESLKRELLSTVLCLSPSQLVTLMPSQFLSPQGLSNASPGMVERDKISNQTHESAITTLRLCPLSSSKKDKDVMNKSTLNGPQELLIGDEQGYVSRWTVMKLDQLDLTQRDLRGLGLKVPPYREKTPEGVASVGTFPSAGGLLKLLGNVYIYVYIIIYINMYAFI